MGLEEYCFANGGRRQRQASRGSLRARRLINNPSQTPGSLALIPALLVAAAMILVPSLARGWGNDQTHQGLLEIAIVRSGSDLDQLVNAHYALEKGLWDDVYLRPAIVSEVDESKIPGVWKQYYGEVEKEFETGRFQGNLGLCSMDAPLKNTLPDSPLVWSMPWNLLLTGAWVEDNPNPRAGNHFHDPEVVHPGAITERGLDNRGRGRIIWQRLLVGSEWVNSRISLCLGGTLSDYRYRTGFQLTGASTTDWAFDGRLGATAPNLFDLADAERFLYRAVVGQTEEERTHAMALHFLALGHVVHLLEDMGVPAHTRNDFAADHLAYLFGGVRWGYNLEHFGESLASLQLLGELRNAPGGAFASRARIFLERTNSLPFNTGPLVDVTQFAQSIAPPDTADFEAKDFWDSQLIQGGSPPGAGLAEYSHNHFLSRETAPHSNPDGYAEPESSIATARWCQPLPLRAPDGGFIQSQITGSVAIGRFLSTALVPHLAHCNFWARDYGLLDEAQIPSGEAKFAFTVIEDSVNRDYLELLWPMMIEYVREFLLFYLSPRLEVVPIGENKFTLRNLTHLEFQFDSDALEIIYTDVNGERQTVSPDCGAGSSVKSLPAKTSVNVPALAGDFSCTMPSELPVDAANSLEFWVVVRGAMGDRGHAAPPGSLEAFADGDFSSDFVVAFQRVRPEIIYQGVKGDAATSDAERQHDLYRIGVDLSHSLAPGDKSPPPKNVTAPYRAIVGQREGLSELEEAELDFGVASAEPGGARMVLLGDAGGPDPQAPERFFPTEPWLFDPLHAPQDDPLAFGRVELGALEFVRRLGRDVVWDRSDDSSAWVTFLGKHADPPYWYLVQRDVDAGTSIEATDPAYPLDRISVESAFGTRVAAIHEGAVWNLDVVMINREEGEQPITSTHVFDVSDPDPDQWRVVACDPSCTPSPGRQEVEPDFSPSGEEVVFVSLELGASEGDLMVATVGDEQGQPIDNGPIRVLKDADNQPIRGGAPAFSPDGKWIIFVGEDWDLWVVPAEGVANRIRLTTDGEKKFHPAWLPTLELGP